MCCQLLGTSTAVYLVLQGKSQQSRVQLGQLCQLNVGMVLSLPQHLFRLLGRLQAQMAEPKQHLSNRQGCRGASSIRCGACIDQVQPSCPGAAGTRRDSQQVRQRKHQGIREHRIPAGSQQCDSTCPTERLGTAAALSKPASGPARPVRPLPHSSYLSFAQQDGLLRLLRALLVQRLDDGVQDVGSLLHVPDLDVQATPLQPVGVQAPGLGSTVVQALQRRHKSGLHACAVEPHLRDGQAAGAAQA